MKHNRIKGLLQNPKTSCVVSLVLDEEYTEALKFVENSMNDVNNKKDKNLLTIMFLQLLALIGYKETASVLLEGLMKTEPHPENRQNINYNS